MNYLKYYNSIVDVEKITLQVSGYGCLKQRLSISCHFCKIFLTLSTLRVLILMHFWHLSAYTSFDSLSLKMDSILISHISELLLLTTTTYLLANPFFRFPVPVFFIYNGQCILSLNYLSSSPYLQLQGASPGLKTLS